MLVGCGAELVENPFGEFRAECEAALRGAFDAVYPRVSPSAISLEVPPNPRFGQLTSLLCFDLAKLVGLKPQEMAVRLAGAIDVDRYKLIRMVEGVQGYVNFHVDIPALAELTVESAAALDREYGMVKVEKPLRVIVEHTSANPIHPLHVGQARNPVLGDALARMLTARGHRVKRHFYVNDAGRQTAVVAYGYSKLKKPRLEGKPDHFIGTVYAITSCILEIERLKREVKEARLRGDLEEAARLQRALDGWVSDAARMEERAPELFQELLEGIKEDERPESRVDELIKRYEDGEPDAVKLVRRVCELCLDGMRRTLESMGITFDSWDWESDLIWSGVVSETLNRLMRTPYVVRAGGVLEFDANRVADDLNLRDKLGVSDKYEIPPLTLTRADGTTLYTTRDIAYTLKKFGDADKVINVIGMEQSLAQLQLKLALYALGHEREADNLVHFAYNLVRLPGYRMSSRRGRYIALDKVLEEAVARAYEEVPKHSPGLSEEERRDVSVKVGVGAVKYAMVVVDPQKPVTFTWDRVLNFETNSAPYIQYTHARACSILRRASEMGRRAERPDYSLLKHELERDLVVLVSRFPEVFVEAADNLRPSLIATYANTLSEKFNSFYATLPVLNAEPAELGDARLRLVDATRITLRNALNLLGIDAPERM